MEVRPSISYQPLCGDGASPPWVCGINPLEIACLEGFAGRQIPRQRSGRVLGEQTPQELFHSLVFPLTEGAHCQKSIFGKQIARWFTASLKHTV